MKKDNKQRLFEVMGKLDATFKPRLNEVDAPVNPNANNPNASAILMLIIHKVIHKEVKILKKIIK